MEHTRRLFVGINIPSPVIKILRKKEQQLERAYPALPVRWTPMENLHITVSFLGYVDTVQLPRIIDALTHAVAPHEPFDILFDRLVIGPSENQPKMIWLVASEPVEALGNLKTDIERVVAPLHPSFNAYTPHVTLGRIAQKRWRALDEKPLIDEKTALTVAVESVTLFESTIDNGKRVFVPLASCELRGDSLERSSQDHDVT